MPVAVVSAAPQTFDQWPITCTFTRSAKLAGGWQDAVEEIRCPIRERILAPLVAEMHALPEPQLEAVEQETWNTLSFQEAI
jgi:hypothetical protein